MKTSRETVNGYPRDYHIPGQEGQGARSTSEGNWHLSVAFWIPTSIEDSQGCNSCRHRNHLRSGQQGCVSRPGRAGDSRLLDGDSIVPLGSSAAAHTRRTAADRIDPDRVVRQGTML